jgi:predicted lactoylglutathione lyase
MIQQLTANLAVDRIEPSAAFFEKIGFEITVQVPEGDHMGFAIMVNGSNQVMFQTSSSLVEDNIAFTAASKMQPAMLYITVDDLSPIKQALDGHKVNMPERETFYGAHEIGYVEPGGHIVTFAHFPDRS